ncbi:hypothetical protein [Pelosinus baikalensis]|uniref:Uncharacterized protein n=1 Tax=Pelosinus baikalensis TaxID=2892015 RepID=A0ABS8HMX5_9FIRM|nr:hypothetical protein [Pelosinus baikalensis]MCC5464494.1 hypothetical protein [Pelosinus baikalensis]
MNQDMPYSTKAGANISSSPLVALEREVNEFAWQLLFDEGACRFKYDNDLGRYVREEGIVELVSYRN